MVLFLVVAECLDGVYLLTLAVLAARNLFLTGAALRQQ
jgi:hypothetical protein